MDKVPQAQLLSLPLAHSTPATLASRCPCPGSTLVSPAPSREGGAGPLAVWCSSAHGTWTPELQDQVLGFHLTPRAPQAPFSGEPSPLYLHMCHRH